MSSKFEFQIFKEKLIYIYVTFVDNTNMYDVALNSYAEIGRCLHFWKIINAL
jgi:hypothetical protein